LFDLVALVPIAWGLPVKSSDRDTSERCIPGGYKRQRLGLTSRDNRTCVGMGLRALAYCLFRSPHLLVEREA